MSFAIYTVKTKADHGMTITAEKMTSKQNNFQQRSTKLGASTRSRDFTRKFPENIRTLNGVHQHRKQDTLTEETKKQDWHVHKINDLIGGETHLEQVAQLRKHRIVWEGQHRSLFPEKYAVLGPTRDCTSVSSGAIIQYLLPGVCSYFNSLL